VLYNSNRNFRDLPKRQHHQNQSMGQLGRHTLWILSRRSNTGLLLAPKSPTRCLNGTHAMAARILRLSLLLLLWICPRGSKALPSGLRRLVEIFRVPSGSQTRKLQGKLQVRFLRSISSHAYLISSPRKCNLIPGNDSKAIDQLPVYSPAIEDSKFTLSSRGSLSDGASMTDVSSNYEIKTPFTPSTNHSAISPTASYIASPMTSNTLNDRSQNGWTPPATNIALTTFSVALPSDHDSRRFTV